MRRLGAGTASSSPPARGAAGELARLARDRGGDLAARVAAHPVGDEDERLGDVVRVLVLGADLAGVRAARGVESRHRTTSRTNPPIWSTSPRFSWVVDSIFISFTYVPFVDPRSDRYSPSVPYSTLACRPDTKASSRTRSATVPRPMSRWDGSSTRSPKRSLGSMNSSANRRFLRRVARGDAASRGARAWTVTARATRRKKRKMTATTSHWSGLMSAV